MEAFEQAFALGHEAAIVGGELHSGEFGGLLEINSLGPEVAGGVLPDCRGFFAVEALVDGLHLGVGEIEGVGEKVHFASRSAAVDEIVEKIIAGLRTSLKAQVAKIMEGIIGKNRRRT